jgi:hypothetical protein
MPVHIAKGRLQQLYNKTFETNAAMLPEQTVPSSLARFSAKTGLLIRPVDSCSLDTLFGELEDTMVKNAQRLSLI